MYLRLFKLSLFLCGASLQASLQPDVIDRKKSNDLVLEKIKSLKRVLLKSNEMVERAEVNPDIVERFLVYEEATNNINTGISSIVQNYSSRDVVVHNLLDCADQCVMLFSCSKYYRCRLAKETFERKHLFAEQSLRGFKKANNLVD